MAETAKSSKGTTRGWGPTSNAGLGKMAPQLSLKHAARRDGMGRGGGNLLAGDWTPPLRNRSTLPTLVAPIGPHRCAHHEPEGQPHHRLHPAGRAQTGAPTSNGNDDWRLELIIGGIARTFSQVAPADCLLHGRGSDVNSNRSAPPGGDMIYLILTG